MRKYLKAVIGGLVAIFVIIQLIPIDRSNPPVRAEINAPAEVMKIIQRSCYDCHSNRTQWPWYSYVAPVSWLVVSDVNEGREHLNFTTWNVYDVEKKREKLEEIVEETEEGEMPLWYYTLFHSEANLSKDEVQLFRTWSEQFGNIQIEEDD